MKFLHLFLIYMFIKDESDYKDWQKEAKFNEEATAETAYVESMRLLRDGEEVTLKSWAADIINEMHGMCEVLGIDEDRTLSLMLNRISNPDLTYGKRLLKLIKEHGYINTHVELSKNNKRTSINSLKNADPDECEDLRKYLNIALAGK
jgi:glutamate--cysteine ligase